MICPVNIGGKSGGSWDPSSQKKIWKSDFAENFSGSGCRVKNAAKKKKKRRENFCRSSRQKKISAEVLGRRKFLQKFYSEENFCRNSRQEKISAENLGRRKFLQK